LTKCDKCRSINLSHRSSELLRRDRLINQGHVRSFVWMASSSHRLLRKKTAIRVYNKHFHVIFTCEPAEEHDDPLAAGWRSALQ
jgi:hypothetical protein